MYEDVTVGGRQSAGIMFQQSVSANQPAPFRIHNPLRIEQFEQHESAKTRTTPGVTIPYGR